jgi:hypothetical protein
MQPYTTDELKDILLDRLADIGAWLYNSAATTNSHYLKFHDRRVGSLTIRDHPGRKKYHYKWNLIIGYKGPHTIKDARVTRCFYDEKHLQDLIMHILNYHRTVTRDGTVQEWSEQRRARGRKQNF